MSEHGNGAHINVSTGKGGGVFRYIPYFVVILVLFILGKSFGVDAQKAWFSGTNFAFTWAELLLILSAIIALAEQMKVSHPGIDNTWEALTMVGMGVLQLVLFVLGAAKVGGFNMFANAGFMILTIISISAAIVAVLINARTLRRTIGVGDN